jgi:multidrug resistance efflux pump
MIEAATQSAQRPGAVAQLAALQQLTLEAGLSANQAQLVFRILNRTIMFCRYDRAVLWDVRGRPRLLGVSGQNRSDPRGALLDAWRRVVAGLPRTGAPVCVAPRDGAAGAAWAELRDPLPELSAVWVPIVCEGRAVAGLWLERWGGAPFAAAEAEQLAAVGLAYAVAWRSVARARGRLRSWLAARRTWVGAAAVIALAAALAGVRVPLRIVAPCEVIPADPIAVTAPLDGVIDQVHVLPGAEVAPGALLASYDRHVADEELKVARQQVEIVASDLQRARVQAFDQAAARAEIALLENRLAQERARLRLAEERAARLEVRAPEAGIAMLADPHAWRGRPVQVGERLLLLVDPQRTRVQIWLPDSDNIAFDTRHDVQIVLAAAPGERARAALRFVANETQVNAAGVSAFRAEAEWQAAVPAAKPGLQGTAVLYGADVPLGYWLFRRPLAAVRRFAGI